MGLVWPPPAPHDPEAAELPLLPEALLFLEVGPGARVTLARLCGPEQRPEYGGPELSGELSSDTEREGNSRPPPNLGSGDSGSG